ncbi:MAG: phosphotransferase family protein [Candidatus Ornithospirochaeta sp.]
MIDYLKRGEKNKKMRDMVECKAIDKGWSSDRKYLLKDKEGKKYLLRLSDISKKEEKEKEYEMLSLFSSLGFPSSYPIEKGITEDGKDFYMLLEWVEGEDMEKILPTLNKEEQYNLGSEAGHILSMIHSLPVKEEDIPLKTKKEKKLRQLEKYKLSENRIEGDEVYIEYIEDNIDSIWIEPPVYLHGDFHPGNLIYTPNKRVGVIDYNRWEVGDRYEEFYKTESFGVNVSMPYSIGIIDSYFNHSVPLSFWEAFALYSIHAALYSIKWAESFGKDDIEKMTRIGKRILSDFGDLSSPIPSWYRKK